MNTHCIRSRICEVRGEANGRDENVIFVSKSVRGKDTDYIFQIRLFKRFKLVINIPKY